MCGIVGYCGPKDCTDVLIDSLSKLEYRGYDSAGIAVFENEKIEVAKEKGRLRDLVKKMNETKKPQGHVGIGHTRWATHGEPSVRNAHPHTGGRVTIVHNGIIENYKKIKDFLTSKGKKFLSDTDTEVAAQLIDYYYDGDPLQAILRAAADLEGSYALGILFAEYPDRLYAIEKEAPLVVGVGNGENLIASDITAILKYTKNYYLLDTNDVALIDKSGVTIYDSHGTKTEKELQTADWDVTAAEKGGYEHFMMKEIHEQPAAIKRTILPRIQDGMPNLAECGITVDSLKGIKRIFITACGTAMHAGIVGKYVIESLARVPVIVDIASEFRYRNPIIGEGDLVIIISQSGETADSLAAMRLSKKLGAKTLAIVNAKGSTIAREADMLIYTHAGPEIAVASTKAYMVQIAVMYLLAFELAFAKGKISESRCKDYVFDLQKIPEKIENVLENEKETQYIASKLINCDSLLYIGRGLDYALSMEGSLKLKEISYIHSESYAAGELKHGTISLVSDGMPVIAVATQSNLLEKTVSNIKEVKSRGAMTIVVCRDSYKPESDVADYVFSLPDDIDDILMPMAAVVPLQLIAYYTAVLKGNDVDKPRNLAKSVTVE